MQRVSPLRSSVGYIARWRQRKRYYEATVARRELTTAVIDRSEINVTVPGIEAKWQWTAVEGCTFERGPLLVWVGPSQAAAIPCRSFESRDSCLKALAFIRARLVEAKRPGAQPQGLNHAGGFSISRPVFSRLFD
jgi:hypothetical protein